MGEQIVTQYENYQELLLDLDIFGRLSSTKQMNLDEYKDLFFEEFSSYSLLLFTFSVYFPNIDILFPNNK